MTEERPAMAGRFRVSPLEAYVWLVIAGGVGVVGLMVAVAVEEGYRPAHGGLALLFVLCMLAAEVRPVSWLRKEEAGFVTVSMAYSAALMFVLPGYAAAVVVALGSVIADCIRRLAPMKLAFNAGMMALALASATAVLRAGDAQALLGRERTDLEFLGWVILANLVLYCVNSLLINTAVALAQGSPMREVMRRDFLLSLPTDGILLPLGPVLVVIGDTHPVLLPFAMMLTLAVYRSARNAAEKTRDATIDPLTGLVNRRLFDDEAEAVLERARRQGTRVAILLMDLDSFKEINDSLGHHVGDDVLAGIAERLKDLAPSDALVARLGGDEFAVMLPQVRDEQHATDIADRIAVAFDEPLSIPSEDTMELIVGGSIGVAVSSEMLTTVGAMARVADGAMYRAKREGRSVVLADHDAIAPDTGREELERAIAEEQLLLHYQPIIETRTRAVLGFEALVRWEHPTRGVVPPNEFIPLAESGPLIRPLTSLVLRDALAALVQMNERGHDLTMSVNISARNLTDPGFASEVRGLLAQSEIQPDRLVLEITESAVMENVLMATRTLNELRAIGVGVALDDFGAGYSSLAKLRDLPVTILKIDRSFISDLETASGAALMRTIVELAQSLGLRTTAEGIEDPMSLSSVSAAGCIEAQGYHISKPMALGEAHAWLAGRASIDPYNGRAPSEVLAP